MESFWEVEGGKTNLLDSLVYRDPLLRNTVDPSSVLFLNPTIGPKPQADRMQKLQSYYFWPFGLYGPDDAAEFTRFKNNLVNNIWPIQDLSRTAVDLAEDSQGPVTRVLWTPFYLSTVISSRLLGDDTE